MPLTSSASAASVLDGVPIFSSLSEPEFGFLTARLRLAKSDGARKWNGVTITLPANNNELAAQIGTVRELVSRNLSRLQSEGLIEMDGRTVMIPNLSKLEAELDPSQERD